MKPEEFQLHVERPTRMRDGKTYCACGDPWPCVTVREDFLERQNARAIEASKNGGTPSGD